MTVEHVLEFHLNLIIPVAPMESQGFADPIDSKRTLNSTGNWSSGPNGL